MLADVWRKTLFDQRRALVGWVSSIVLVVLLYAAIWPSLRDQPSMSDFLDQMPEAFRSLFATAGADMSTPTGYIQIELMSFMAPALLIIYAVGQGSSAVAGEEDRHSLDLLLGAPVSRTRVLLDKALALVIGTVLLVVVTGAALVLEGAAFDLHLPLSGVVAAMTHLAALSL
ncbi:MAG TPA: ABC transporter permease subunit, partial [Pedococcus sp.]|nr:ABC transporter permease subunit [Pedococcus sp.]